MIKNLILCVSILVLLGSCNTVEKQNFDLLILNATIIDVETGKLLPNKLIGITKDTIRLVDDMAKRENIKGEQLLDVKNKYVMPGLWDMHVHFRGGDSLVEENMNLLPLFLSYGITSVRDAGGDITPSVMIWRDKIQNGTLDGPTIFTSGPKLDGSEPTWPGSIKVVNSKDIEKALDSLQLIGVDYVKMYDGSLSKDAFYGIIQAAEKRGMKTTGHMPLSADLMEAIDYGLDGTEHMYYTLKACSPLADSLTKLNIGYGMMDQILASYDPKLANKVFSKMSDKNVFITPTLYIGKTLSELLDVDHSKDSLLPYIGRGIQQSYQGRIENAKRAQSKGDNSRKKMEQLALDMMGPMYDAGVKIIAGSDCGAFNSFVYPGESLHKELVSFVKAGLTPQQALVTSVINGPKFFELEDYYGSVDIGKVADLVLLDKNPLDNIENISKIIALVKNGKLYKKDSIDKMILKLKEEKK